MGRHAEEGEEITQEKLSETEKGTSAEINIQSIFRPTLQPVLITKIQPVSLCTL